MSHIQIAKFRAAGVVVVVEINPGPTTIGTKRLARPDEDLAGAEDLGSFIAWTDGYAAVERWSAGATDELLG